MKVYLDHAASTYVEPEVLKAMLPYYSQKYANPSSQHSQGTQVRQDIEAARENIARIFKVVPEEIIFTSSGTESVNLAIQGVALAKGAGHIITSAIEHPAVLNTCRALQQRGFSITYLPANRFGTVSITALEKALRKDTILISIMYANNEVGTIQPIADISTIARRHNIPFHSDACQMGVYANTQYVDLLSLNGSKMYGPKGTGILYKRKRVHLRPLLYGGGQEFDLRSGTENVPGIIGFAKALEIAATYDERKIRTLSSYLIGKLLQIPQTQLNGHPKKRLQNNVHISFLGVEAESLLKHLDLEGIYVSTGAACSSKQIEVSHVLKAMGLPEEVAQSSIRFTLGRNTSKKELEYVLKKVKIIVGALRKV